MIIHENTLISDDLLKEFFACDIQRCKGACCIEGDKGAPISKEEVVEIERIMEPVLEELSPEHRDFIQKNGFYEEDDDGELVTTCLDDGKCCFVVEQGNGVLGCGIENAFYKNKVDFVKPISCHLYPVRIREFDTYTTLNYHEWYLCQAACSKGRSEQIKVYEFTETALRRRFGDDWYEGLVEIDRNLNA
ncbi:MAG: DUF3109 family protein [Bacteroidia bacterium]|nr:DUF3109 family protein [Bacteroidia bacterium]